MRARLIALFIRVRESYWLIPAAMALAAFGLSVLCVYLDTWLGSEWFKDVPWLHANEPEGGRAMLSTIAGSVISVAGVTFSITIAALSLASSQYGPRLIAGFMKDRGNQFVLGTYTATFIYCLLVLRTIQSTQDGEFVPQLSILVGLLLAILSVGVLIYFINHVSQSIRASHVIHQVSLSLDKRIDNLLLQPGQPAHAVDGGKRLDVPEDFDDSAVRIRAPRPGYVQALDVETLMDMMTSRNLVAQVQARPGDFVINGGELVRIAGEGADDRELGSKLQGSFVLGNRRTDTQDALYLMQQLVEVAARAISPGINDPNTAITCIDWITAAMSRIAIEYFPSAYRYDDAGVLRLVYEPVEFSEFVDAVYNPLRQYGREMVEINVRLLQSIEAIGHHALNPDHRVLLRRHARCIHADAMAHLPNADDRDRVEHQYRTTMQSVTRDGRSEGMAGDTLPRLPW
jgi:uncharacterized membrane protein